MKTKFYLLGLMLGALSLTSCSKDEALTPNEGNDSEISFTVASEDPELPLEANGTRTEYTPGQGIHFLPAEKMTVLGYGILPDGTAGNASNGKTADRDATTKMLKGRFEKVMNADSTITATEYHLYFVSPSAIKPKHNETFTEALEFNFPLAAAQTPTAESFDPNADVLVSKEVVYTLAEGVNPTIKGGIEISDKVTFKRLFTFLRLVLDPATGYDATTWGDVKSVTIQSTGAELAGEVTVKPNADYSLVTPTFAVPSDNIVATYAAPLAMSKEQNVWIVLNPTTVKGLTITMETTKGVVKQVIPTTKEITFQPNKINQITFQNKADITTFTPATVEPTADGYFEKGLTVNVGGVDYSKTTPGAVLVKNGEFTPSKAGVVFVSGKISLPTTSQGIHSELVLIGNSETEQTVLEMPSFWSFRNPTGKIAFKNVILDARNANAQYMFNLADSGDGKVKGGLKELIVEDCVLRVGKNMTLLTLYNALNSYWPEKITFKNCRIEMDGPALKSDKDTYLLNMNTKDKTTTVFNQFTNLTVENCILYCKGEQAKEKKTTFLSVVQNLNKADNKSVPNLNIVFKNSTVVNMGYYMGLFKVGGGVKSIIAEKNILYNTFKDTAILGLDQGATVPADYVATPDNIYYGKNWRRIDKEHFNLKIEGTKPPKYNDPEGNLMTNATTAPITITDDANAQFTVDDSAADYGATIK